MSNDTVGASAPTAPEEPDEAEIKAEITRRYAFERALARYLRARAAQADAGTDASDDNEDDIARRITEEDAATRELMLAPAACWEMLALKFEAFEALLGEELRLGPRRRSFVLVSAGALKQDIANLGAF